MALWSPNTIEIKLKLFNLFVISIPEYLQANVMVL